MTRLILVRHGESAWNRELRYQGHRDIELSSVGWAQAECLRQRLQKEPLDAVYSSDLRRAAETAALIVRGRGLEPILRPDLREANLGLWEGLTYAEARAAWPKVAERRRLNPAHTAPPQGESLRQVKRRVCAAIEEITRRHPDQTVLIVSHSGPLHALVCALLGLKLKAAWQLRLDNGSITIIDTYPEGAILSLFNDVNHLKGLEGQAEGSACQT